VQGLQEKMTEEKLVWQGNHILEKYSVAFSGEHGVYINGYWEPSSISLEELLADSLLHHNKYIREAAKQELKRREAINHE
jgi:hypothetical protein